MSAARMLPGLALAACVAQAMAQPPTLAGAVEAAWRRSAQSTEMAGQADRAEAERAAASARWAGPPALLLGTGRDRQRGTSPSRETEIGLAVPLWLPGQQAARLGRVEAEVEAARAQAAAARLGVAGAVRESAAEVALQRAELAAAQAQLGELEALARDVERRVAAGDLARADALAANAERLAAANALAQARQRLGSAELRWSALTGLADLPSLPQEAAAPAGLAHPALLAVARRVDAARQRLELARSTRRDAPEIRLQARQESAAGEPGIQGVGISLRLPLASDARQAPLLAAALAELDLAQAQERQLRQQLHAEQAAAGLALESARQQLADERARARLLRERADLIDRSFRAGETALPDMLRALTAARQAQASAARAEAALAQAASRLQQAFGVMP